MEYITISPNSGYNAIDYEDLQNPSHPTSRKFVI